MMSGALSHFGEQEKMKKEHIVRYSLSEIKTMLENGKSQTDWEKAGAMTEEQLEASIVADPDEAGLEFDWSKASPHLHEPKAVLHMRVDKEVLDFFKAQGKGYQTKINSVLLSYVKAQRKSA